MLMHDFFLSASVFVLNKQLSPQKSNGKLSPKYVEAQERIQGGGGGLIG